MGYESPRGDKPVGCRYRTVTERLVWLSVILLLIGLKQQGGTTRD